MGAGGSRVLEQEVASSSRSAVQKQQQLLQCAVIAVELGCTFYAVHSRTGLENVLQWRHVVGTLE